MRVVAATAVWLCASVSGAGAQRADLAVVKTLSLKAMFATKGDWYVTAYEPPGDAARTGDVPARVCFWEAPRDTGKFCTTFRSASVNSNEKPQVFQTIDDLSIAHLTGGPRPVLAVHLNARMSYGGSGALEQTDLWTYDPASD